MKLNFKELGFTPFHFDGLTLHCKDFPEINYTLCESENDTFTISTFEDGNIVVRLSIEYLEKVNLLFSTAESEITNFKVQLCTAVQSLIPTGL